jgi:hypothetical protein
MPDYVTLIGAETVQSAASVISSAADRMVRIPGDLDAVLGRYLNRLEELMQRSEVLVDREKRLLELAYPERMKEEKETPAGETGRPG